MPAFSPRTPAGTSGRDNYKKTEPKAPFFYYA